MSIQELKYKDMEGKCKVGNTSHATTRLKVVEHLTALANMEIEKDSEVVYHVDYSISFNMKYVDSNGKKQQFKGKFTPKES